MTQRPPGSRQSPIALDTFVPADLPVIRACYGPTGCRFFDNGFTVEVRTDEGGELWVGDELLPMQQFHFHTPGEHTLFGRSFPLEVHFVHMDAGGDRVVLAVLAEYGESNAALAQVIAALPDGTPTLDPGAFLPDLDAHLFYDGSLTTPPYSEGTRWLVAATPIQVSREQVKAIDDRAPNSTRDLQDPAGRVILGSLSLGSCESA